MRSRHLTLLAMAIRSFGLALLLGIRAYSFAETPSVGAVAPDFTLSSPNGKTIRMSGEMHGHDLVLVVLRGFPGYQCPYCVKQVHDFVAHSDEFAKRKVRVLLVYPGPPADLDERAKEFLAKQSGIPENIDLVTDPDYTVTKLYGVRWEAPNETAYPSTFIIDRKQHILFEKISHSHGDRLSAEETLSHLQAR